MEKVTQEWLDISHYDLDTARSLLSSGKFLYVAFMCQQSLEKLLKALYVQRKRELPPRTHNLLYLAEVLDLSLDVQKDVLARLNQFYLESRYPGERTALAKEMTKEVAGEVLKETSEVWDCIRKMLI